MNPSIVCVLGMHRSGTSLVARLVEFLGWNLGPVERMIEPAPDNPAGFWENRRLSEVNREVLERLGGRWNSLPEFPPGWETDGNLDDLRQRARDVVAEDFAGSGRWAWKDPRTCLTLPFWRRLLPPMRYVLVVRNPLDVANSLSRRIHDPVPRPEGLDLWLAYVLASLRHTGGERRLIVRYEELMRNTSVELDRLNSFLGGPDIGHGSETQLAALQGVEHELWHQRTPPGDIGDAPGVPSTVSFLYSALLRAAAPEPAGDAPDPFGMQTSETSEVRGLRAQLTTRDHDIAQAKAREAVLRAELTARDRDIGAQSAQLVEGRRAATEVRERLSTREAELLGLHELRERDEREHATALRDLNASVERMERARSSEEHRASDALVRGLRAAVDRVVPRGARVLVASAGNEELLRLRGRPASHFPQRPGGIYAGSDPESSKAAITHLEFLRARGAQFLVLPPGAFWWLDHYGGLREHLADQCRLVHSDDRCLIYDVRAYPAEKKRRRLRRRRTTRPVRRRVRTRSAGGNEYARLRGQIRDAVKEVVPPGATVVVASKGDDELLNLDGRRAWHYPQSGGGTYAGHHPADGNAAVAHLDELRARGAEYFVLPSTAYWWLDHYPELRHRLEDESRAISKSTDVCLIYDVRGAPQSAPAGRPQVVTAGRSDDRGARVRHVADASLPPDAAIVAVAEDDRWSRDIGRRRVRRLPNGDDLTAAQAVGQLERFRSEGAEYLVVPASSPWWEKRPGFRRYVESCYEPIVRDRACAIYSLGEPRPRTASLKVSVLCWDMGHNPLGRAHVLADLLRGDHDVEIVGPHFDRYGTGIWKPLEDSAIPMRTFRGSLFPEHFATMEEVASRIDGDVLYASKSRWPSYGLGILAKTGNNRPLLVDCDDREVTFFGGDAHRVHGGNGLSAPTRDPEFYNPFGAVWTERSESLVHHADHVTVSNHTLSELYGGTLIPHARDERVFDPSAYDRDKVRADLGIAPDQKMVFFGGTPRRHKGLQTIAAALARIGDPRYRLCVIGTGDYAQVRRELGALNAWVDEVSVQPFERLPALLAAADLVCVLQDPSSEISRYQIPAKVTDAIAMGVPCIATPVAPLEPLIEKGAIIPLAGAPLHELIHQTFTDAEMVARTACRGRELFLEDYSYAAVRPRLTEVIARLASAPPPVPPELAEIVGFQRSVFTSRAGSTRRDGLRRVTRKPARRPPRAATPRRAGAAVRTNRSDEPVDIVVFWKHNDTGLYGRRQDMLVRYLARSERVNQIVHFDAPVDLGWVRRNLMPADAQANHARQLALQTLRRVGRLVRDPKVHYRTFLHREDDGIAARSLASRLLPSPDGYIDWIDSVLTRRGVGRRPTVFWAYPRLFGFPDIADAFAPDVVVSDIVDDDRTWLDPDSEFHGALTRNYEDILRRTDIALASTESVREAMSAFAPEIHLVPNACEFPDPASSRCVPREMRRMRGPIIGYVGNLSSRIDISLLEHLVTARPEWNLVLIGSAHLDRQILRLCDYPNVHMLGMKPYEQAKRFIRAFDVAIIPHVDGPMTRSMHPLKAFVYAAQNVPIVSTNIANLGELRPFVQIAAGPSDFVWQVELALAAGKPGAVLPELAQVLERNSWTNRVETILGLLGDHLSTPRRPARAR